jgi:organic radical activating enzyme
MNQDREQGLPLMEQFYTLQGEGVYSGQAAYFIRLGGCDVGCSWCDVKESWDAGAHPIVAVSAIVAQALQFAGRLAVITGGEPLLYNLDELTAALQKAGFRTHIETSGAYPLSGSWDWITVSPKKFKAPLPEILPFANELKIIVYNRHDFVWAESFAAEVSKDCQLLLQPEWGKSEEMLPFVIAYVKENPKWKISLQTHKYMEIP